MIIIILAVVVVVLLILYIRYTQQENYNMGTIIQLTAKGPQDLYLTGDAGKYFGCPCNVRYFGPGQRKFRRRYGECPYCRYYNYFPKPYMFA